MPNLLNDTYENSMRLTHAYIIAGSAQMLWPGSETFEGQYANGGREFNGRIILNRSYKKLISYSDIILILFPDLFNAGNGLGGQKYPSGEQYMGEWSVKSIA